MERISRLKLDLEAVVEDVSDEVHIFEIQISLIYLKFVGIVQHLIIIYYQPLSATLCQNHSWGRIIPRNPIILSS